ncbi:MAG: SurA N-terminal domain-containing protein [Ignavibacteriales bacterium]|nr:SurA N-terminal domain-containing protein [Ignavibacteriales bacterium]
MLALAGVAGACQSKPAAPPVSADAWAVVDGREITRADVEKAYRRNLQATPAPSEEEAATAKLELLDQLIVQDLLLAKARALKIELPDTELDAAYARGPQGHPGRGVHAGTGQAEPDGRPTCARGCAATCWCRSCSSARSRRRSPSPTRRSRRSSRPTARSSTAPRTRTASRRSSSRRSATPRIANRTGQRRDHAPGGGGEGADGDGPAEGGRVVRRTSRRTSRRIPSRRRAAATSASCRCRRCSRPRRRCARPC